MTDNYAKLVQDNLKKLYSDLPRDLDQRLLAIREADRFMPMDGLADVGEYTSKKIMDLVT